MSGELLTTIAAGSRSDSEAAFAEIVRVWQGPITGYAYKMLRSWDSAEDVFQSVMMSVFTHAGGFRQMSTIFDTEIGKNSGFSGWLYTIAHRKCLDTIRKRKCDPLANRINPTDDFDPLATIHVEAHSTLDTLIDSEDVRNIKAALDDVPDSQRATFELYAEGFSLPEIAEAGGVCASTAKSHLRLAREKVRERIQS